MGHGRKRDWHYYNGVATRLTTRCCSAVALTLLISTACAAQTAMERPTAPPKPARGKPDRTPLGLFPVRRLWTLPLNVQLAAPPAFYGLRAFFSIEGGRIVAYNLTAGTQLWTAEVATTSRPAVSDDLLFVVADGAIDALRVSDGSLAWSVPFTDALAAPLVFDNGWLVAATADAAVIAFRATDGHQVWRSEIGSPAHTVPTLADDRVYIPAEDGRVVALRVTDGSVVWTHRLGGAPNEILASGDRLFLGSKDNTFYCLKAQDGSVDWPVVTGADVIGLPTIDARNVYFVSLDNVLRAVHRGNGNQEWKRALAVRPTAGPVQALDVILVTSISKTLPAFTAIKGAPAGDIGGGDEIAAPPHIAAVPGIFGPVVFVVTNDLLKGSTVVASARSIEPAVSALAALPNPISITPAGPAPTAPTIPKF
jgi:outer membrane protein assembly factor BamB